MTSLTCITKNIQTTQACVIWLHGLGADGHDFEPVVDLLNLPYIKFILPHAPYRPVTLNNGYEMRAWYDIFGLAPDSPQDADGIHAMQIELEALIAHEIALGIPASRIVLAGFSQGGAMVLHTACRYAEKLAGVLALSTYLPLRDQLLSEHHPANTNTPIWMAHGVDDSVITLRTATIAREALMSAGFDVLWHTYPMAHNVSETEIADIRTFLQAVLPEKV